MDIDYATIGGARVAIANGGNRDNRASTLYVSYAAPVNPSDPIILNLVDPPTVYNKELVLSGIPLSMSLFLDQDTEPSAMSPTQIASFWALSVIENNDPEDPVLADPSGEINIPTDPSDRTFTFNGNRLSASKKNERYYFNVVNTGHIGNAERTIILMGTQMALGTQGELILYDSGYTLPDVEEFVSILIGGQPLTAGRIGNNYYLIISPITADEA